MMRLLALITACLLIGAEALADEAPSPWAVLKPDAFKHYVDAVNAADVEDVVNEVPNAGAWDWLRANVPLFECPEPDFERIYYYRWWAFRKHVKRTPAGLVLTEFITPVKHAGVYNTISCATGHHL